MKKQVSKQSSKEGSKGREKGGKDEGKNGGKEVEEEGQISVESKLRAIFSGHNSVINHIDLSYNGLFMQSNCSAYELLFADTTAGGRVIFLFFFNLYSPLFTLFLLFIYLFIFIYF